MEIEADFCKSIPAFLLTDKAPKAVVNDNCYGALPSLSIVAGNNEKFFFRNHIAM